MGSIFMNIASNMLGLDNAATPTGLKAMQQMQELNTKKDTATNPMIMFLVLNTSGLTIIPTTILAFRASYGAAQPTDVFIPILMLRSWLRLPESSSLRSGSASTSCSRYCSLPYWECVPS